MREKSHIEVLTLYGLYKFSLRSITEQGKYGKFNLSKKTKALSNDRCFQT